MKEVCIYPVSYTHLRAHETDQYLVCRLLLESAKVQGLHIPRQTRLIAVAKIEGNRMHLLIKSIEVDGHIIAVKLSAYDTDGQEGVYIPCLLYTSDAADE